MRDVTRWILFGLAGLSLLFACPETVASQEQASVEKGAAEAPAQEAGAPVGKDKEDDDVKVETEEQKLKKVLEQTLDRQKKALSDQEAFLREAERKSEGLATALQAMEQQVALMQELGERVESRKPKQRGKVRSPGGKPKQKGKVRGPGEIIVGNPEVVTRERLVNDRLRQEEWLYKQLKEAEKEKFGLQGLTDTRSFFGLSARVGIEADTNLLGLYDAQSAAAIADTRRNQEQEALQNQIDTLEKLKTINQLQADLESSNGGGPTAVAAATEGEGGGSGEGDGESEAAEGSAEASEETGTVTNPSSVSDNVTLNFLDRLLKENRSSLLPDPGKVGETQAAASPMDVFRDHLAYREEIRNEIFENALDDRHDLRGNTAYRINIDATILPKKKQDAWAVVEVEVSEDASEILELLDSWKIDLEREINDLLLTRLQSAIPCYGFSRHDASGTPSEPLKSGCLPESLEREILDHFQRVLARGLGNGRGLGPTLNGKSSAVQILEVSEAYLKKMVAYESNRSCRAGGCTAVDEERELLAININAAVDALADTVCENKDEARRVAALAYLLASYHENLYSDIERLENWVLIEWPTCDDYPHLKVRFWEKYDNQQNSDKNEKNCAEWSEKEKACTRQLEMCEKCLMKPEEERAVRDLREHLLRLNEWKRSTHTNRFLEFADERDKRNKRNKEDQEWEGDKKAIETELRERQRIYAFAATPKETVQRISEVAARRSSIELAALLSSRSGSGAVEAINESQRLLHGIGRQPLVVGFTKSDYRPGQRSEVAAAGWILGPRFKISDAMWVPPWNRGFRYQHVPVQNNLAFTISVPEWWTSAELTIKTHWRTKKGKKLSEATASKHVIELPGKLRGITRALVQYRLPQVLQQGHWNVVQGKPASLLIRGDDLWRSSKVTLGGQTDDGIEVLPNMRGIVASFKPVTEPADIGGKKPRNVPVYVWTSEGSQQAGYVTIHQGTTTAPKPLKLKVDPPRLIQGQKLFLKVTKGSIPEEIVSRLAVQLYVWQGAAFAEPPVFFGSEEIIYDEEKKIVKVTLTPKKFESITDVAEVRVQLLINESKRGSPKAVNAENLVPFYKSEPKIEWDATKGDKEPKHLDGEIHLSTPKFMDVAFPGFGRDSQLVFKAGTHELELDVKTWTKNTDGTFELKSVFKSLEDIEKGTELEVKPTMKDAALKEVKFDPEKRKLKKP